MKCIYEFPSSFFVLHFHSFGKKKENILLLFRFICQIPIKSVSEILDYVIINE
jgi:hypothetical protein